MVREFGVDRGGDAELAGRFRDLARTSTPRAPLNAAVSTGIADRPDLFRLLREAPPEQRVPVLLLAAIHDLVLREPDHELARWYASVVDAPRPADDPRLMPVLVAFVADRTDELAVLLRHRRTQTNEEGRCSLFLLALEELRGDGPFAQIDIGASAGLNLLMDRYEYHYDPGGIVGGPSTVVIPTGVRGAAPHPSAPPDLRARCGIDVAPVDVTDPDAARWLEACCWPDQRDRVRRLHAAIEIARAHPPELLAGEAVASIVTAIERMSPRGRPLVTTSWVLNYLSPADRTRFVDALDRAAEGCDLVWVAVESPSQTPELPWPEESTGPPGDQTHVLRVRWQRGRRSVEDLGRAHPHGYWMHWKE